MLKFVIGRRGQTRRRPQRSVSGGIRALAFSALAAVPIASFATSASAQRTDIAEAKQENNRNTVRAGILAGKGNGGIWGLGDDNLRNETCKTRAVQSWLANALELESKEPPFVDPKTDIGKAWLSLRRAIIRLSNLPPCGDEQQRLQFGIYFIKTTGSAHTVERSDFNDAITNDFHDRHDPVGGGLLLGYRFNAGSNIGVMPFVSVDFPNTSVNHTFANGNFLGTTSDFSATAGVKLGPQLQNFWLYGIAGVSVLNETLKVNFLPVTSSTDTIVPGGTIGAGFAYTLPNFSKVSLFAEYQHTWWRAGKFNTPLASPLFDYAFARQDDVAKVGFTVSLGPPPPPAGASGLPVKALPPK
jgi:hypothetical protein